MQSEFLQNHLGVAGQGFEFLVRTLGVGEFDQFHFLKLMLADDAANVFAVGTSFAAKARRVGCEADGQT